VDDIDLGGLALRVGTCRAGAYRDLLCIVLPEPPRAGVVDWLIYLDARDGVEVPESINLEPFFPGGEGLADFIAEQDVAWFSPEDSDRLRSEFFHMDERGRVVPPRRGLRRNPRR
jgi:hypothetical protein